MRLVQESQHQHRVFQVGAVLTQVLPIHRMQCEPTTLRTQHLLLNASMVDEEERLFFAHMCEFSTGAQLAVSDTKSDGIFACETCGNNDIPVYKVAIAAKRRNICQKFVAIVSVLIIFTVR